MRFIAGSIAVIMVFSAIPVFATEAEPIVPASLSLADAIKYMQESSNRAETAKQNKKSDKIVSEGYSEKVTTITRTQKDLSNAQAALGAGMAQIQMGLAQTSDPATRQVLQAKLSGLAAQSELLFQKTYEAQTKGVTSGNKKIMILRRDFAKEHLETNAKAEMNEIEAATIDIYYKLVLAKENYEIATKNVETQEKTKKMAELKKKVGLVPKKDVLAVNSALANAKMAQREAWTQLEMARMGFNFMLGYPVTARIELTDKISDQVSNDETPLDEGVKNTLKNRQELPGAKLAVDIYELLLEEVRDYPTNSTKYMTAALDLEEARKTLKDAPQKLELDTRNKYNVLQDKKYSVEYAKELLVYAKEGERLMLLTYDAGVSTIDELLEIQVKRNQAELNLAKAKSDYALAKKFYEYAQGVGVTRLPL